MQVYLLTNLINGKYYVGKTVSKNLTRYLSGKRWAARHGQCRTMAIVNAMAKHGVDNFSSSVLAVAASREQLDALERLWIIVLDSRNSAIGYNISAGGGGASRPCSEETKRRIGIANKGRKPKIYVRTEEHRQQLRDRMQGNDKGIKLTREFALAQLASETEEQKKARFASIKSSWDRYTPEQRAARIKKMQDGRIYASPR